LHAAATMSRYGVLTQPFTLQVEHHARNRRFLADRDAVAARIAAVETRSTALLSTPLAHLRPVSD